MGENLLDFEKKSLDSMWIPTTVSSQLKGLDPCGNKQKEETVIDASVRPLSPKFNGWIISNNIVTGCITSGKT